MAEKKLDMVVGADDVAALIAKWTGIPVNRLLESEASKLANMEEGLHQRVIGQEEAVTAISHALRRSRAGLQDLKRPIGSFIFLGPTGVGKTELARALAEFLFDDEDNMVRLDMSEYTEKHTVRNYPYQTLGSKQGTILDESHRSITHERRQPSHRAYKTICRRGELAFDGQRRWLSPRLHSLQTPRGTHLALGCLSSPLMTSWIIATLVLDGARRCAPTLAGIPPGTLPPQQAETPTSWHARSPASEVMVAPRKSRRTLRSNWSFKGVSELSPIGRLQRDCGIQN